MADSGLCFLTTSLKNSPLSNFFLLFSLRRAYQESFEFLWNYMRLPLVKEIFIVLLSRNLSVCRAISFFVLFVEPF